MGPLFNSILMVMLACSSLAAPVIDSSVVRKDTVPRHWDDPLDARHSRHHRSKGWHAPCTNETMAVRYNFDNMPPEDRKAYTDAINCLRAQPSQLDPTVYPGAINRYMDYAAIHINRTSQVHLNGLFLTWHRMFIWVFEHDLKATCGYEGTQPYWDWPSTVGDLRGSNIFNGDEYSMSSDGYPKDLNSTLTLAPTLKIPHGSGGGCIMSGPFKGMTRTFNTIDIDRLLNASGLPADAFAKNETCLTRDLNSFVAKGNMNQSNVDQTLAAPDMATFDFLLNGSPLSQSLGLHSGAHFSLGDPASNIYVSVQDPIWWPLHTELDHIYDQWQKAHPDIATSLSGTLTPQNNPPSANVTLDTWTPDFGYFHASKQVKDLMDISAGPFCYKYE